MNTFLELKKDKGNIFFLQLNPQGLGLSSWMNEQNLI